MGQTSDVADQTNDVGGKPDWAVWVMAGLGHGWFWIWQLLGRSRVGKRGVALTTQASPGPTPDAWHSHANT